LNSNCYRANSARRCPGQTTEKPTDTAAAGQTAEKSTGSATAAKDPPEEAAGADTLRGARGAGRRVDRARESLLGVGDLGAEVGARGGVHQVDELLMKRVRLSAEQLKFLAEVAVGPATDAAASANGERMPAKFLGRRPYLLRRRDNK
jgi:hypothetical protein